MHTHTYACTYTHYHTHKYTNANTLKHTNEHNLAHIQPQTGLSHLTLQETLSYRWRPQAIIIAPKKKYALHYVLEVV